MACGCADDVCNCKITGTDGVEVTGLGTARNPYVVKADGRAANLRVQSSSTLTLEITGDGSAASPFRLAGKALPTRLLAPDSQVFTAPGAYTWTKPANARMVAVTIIGAGGGGAGGWDYSTGMPAPTPDPRRATGGGGGGVVRRVMPASLLPASLSVQVGAGGAGGAARANGASGGDSKVGDLLVARGGVGGRTFAQARNPFQQETGLPGDVAALFAAGGLGDEVGDAPMFAAYAYAGSSDTGLGIQVRGGAGAGGFGGICEIMLDLDNLDDFSDYGVWPDPGTAGSHGASGRGAGAAGPSAEGQTPHAQAALSLAQTVAPCAGAGGGGGGSYWYGGKGGAGGWPGGGGGGGGSEPFSNAGSRWNDPATLNGAAQGGGTGGKGADGYVSIVSW